MSVLYADSQASDRRVAPWDVAVLLAIVALATLPAWALGAYSASVQVWLAATSILALAVGVIRLWQSATGLPTVLLILLAAIAFGAFQLVPLQAATLEWLSPTALQLRRDLSVSGDLVEGAPQEPLAAVNDEQPLSLYPASTRHDLSLLVLAAAALVLGVWISTLRWGAVSLLAVVAANGAVLSFFGIVQKLQWNGSLFWTIPIQRGAPFASFINRNNAGAYLNLSIACGIGVVVWLLLRSKEKHRYEDDDLTAFQQLKQQIAEVGTPLVAAAAAVAAIAAGVACSLSRGAILSLLFASAVVVVAIGRRQKAALFLLSVIGLAGAGLFAFAGFLEPLQERVAATLDDSGTVSNIRLTHWQDSLEAAGDYSAVGSGLGTYRFVYPAYEERFTTGWFVHAENQYVEALVEGGVTGLVLLVLLIAAVALAIVQLLRFAESSQDYAVAIAALFALASQAVHACFDFALYSPAVFLLFAVIVGLAVGRAAVLVGPTGWLTRLVAIRTGSLLPMTAVLLVAAGVLAFGELRNAAAVEVALRRGNELLAEQQPPEEDLRDAIEGLEQAVVDRPDDAEAHQTLASLWILLYERAAAEQLRSTYPVEVSEELIARAASLNSLHKKVEQLRQSEQSALAEQIASEPAVQDHLVPAAKHLIASIKACPLIPHVHLDLARVSVTLPAISSSATRVVSAVELKPGDAELLYQAGVLEQQSSRLENATRLWRRSVAQKPVRLEEIVQRTLREMDAHELVAAVLPNDPEVLLRVAQKYLSEKEQVEAQQVVLAAALNVFADKPPLNAADFYVKSVANKLSGNHAEAIEDLARATEMAPFNAVWHFELAQLKWENGQPSEAFDHAQRAVRLDSANRNYIALLKVINRAQVLGTESGT